MPRSNLRNYIPTLVLLLIIVGLMVIVHISGSWAGKGAPQVTILDGFLLTVVGFAAGLLGGLIGTGGCSVMLPILHFWMNYSAPLSIGTTLFAVIFTTVSGAYGHLIRKNLDKNAAIWVGGLGTLGVVLGSWLFTLLVKHVSLLNLILGLAFVWPSLRMITEGSGIAKSKAGQQEGKTISGSRLGMGLFGLVIGILTGIVGLGGGYALVPGLIYLFNAPVYVTMGTSLASMIPLAVVGGVIKVAQGYVALGAGFLLGAGTVVGAQVGAAVIKRFKPNVLKLIFGLYFLYVALKFITGYFGIMIW
ncbi:MAG: sulfite exporter TauE/SafE family protein [Candidatus Bathyarchaeia archaeon]